jgi:hypothetical protein
MTEKDDIATAVQHYIDGAKSGSSAEMRRAFHETQRYSVMKAIAYSPDPSNGSSIGTIRTARPGISKPKS